MKEQKERFSKLERAFKILEYLKLNSDSEHTVTQAALRRESEIEPYLGDKETYNDTIVKMAMALNFDEYGVKSENEWKLIFKDFVKKFGAESLDESDSEDEYDDNQTMRIRGLYYNHTFTYEEINSMIESILFSKTIDTESANKIIKKT